ncbi:cystathionine beta-synthase [Crocinitomicaceae bacterium]|nr:cystathionine beta-synthase [Crocinitomicaceae bacterium]
MKDSQLNAFLTELIENMPNDWLRLTTHRLDIYDESQAKTQFLEQLEALFQSGTTSESALSELPTAFDYIRLGHPLSCVLEWALAKEIGVPSDQIISFSSRVTPILAVLRKNLLDGVRTQIFYKTGTPEPIYARDLRSVYGYDFSLDKIDSVDAIPEFEGSTIYVSNEGISEIQLSEAIDFCVTVDARYGSIIAASNTNQTYVGEIQHVRRRESIAMTPADCNTVLRRMVGLPTEDFDISQSQANSDKVVQCVQEITGSETIPVVGSSGLSVQYALMMGVIDWSQQFYPDKKVMAIIPPNCYGGTNDQARRVAACLNHVEVVDLPVDGGKNMVESLDLVLDRVAQEDAVPFIIVEIPTNPRVEVPDLIKLKDVLTKTRHTQGALNSVEPIFVIDQTFCPNFHFLGNDAILSGVQTLSYVSGSKFPSGGLCTAGYVTSNEKGHPLMSKIRSHMEICDNLATNLQMDILAKQLPSMLDRIAGAYQNTRAFVNFINETLPEAKINFVSEELAAQGFTPSVFSLDLPTKGATDEEREMYKRELNLKLIDMMIEAIPEESKYCVSYGQLKGCYWTIPATSTQGTTKEGDKDYIARVALSQNMNLEKHKEVFAEFVAGL